MSGTLQGRERAAPGRGLRRLGAAAVLAVLPALLAPAGWPGAGRAEAEDARGQALQRTRRTPTLRNEVYQRLAAAQQAAEAKDFATAERLLATLQEEFSGTRALNSYELANVHNFYAYIYYSQQKYPEAIRAYEKVLAQPGLPGAMETGTRYSLAQLYLATEDWTRAAAMLESWFAVAEEPAPEAWMLLAQANFQVKRYQRALESFDKGMAEARRRALAPKENWYLLARMICYEKGDLQRTASVLEVLARQWPKKDYFVQLSAVYGELGDEKRQLAAMEAAYLAGWIGAEGELLNMAYLYLGADMPWKAARVLEKGIEAGHIEAGAKNLELLGIALRQARENRQAIVYLERAAALANDAQMWARLASVQLDEDASERAVEAARKALALGGGRRPDSTQLVLGTALYNLGRYDEARAAFTEAGRDPRSEQVATQWLHFLQTEIARAAQLAGDV
jgi:tetratricopeptide (TPR) repeat protein